MKPDSASHAGKRILIVDDVPDNVAVLFDLLTQEGKTSPEIADHRFSGHRHR